MPCADCELCTKASVTCISSNGADNVKVMFIQDAPDEEDEDYEEVFSSKACRGFKLALQKRGITAVYFTSLVRCVPNGDIPSVAVKACTHYLEDEISQLDPDIIVPMGNHSLKFCVGRVGLTKMRGTAQEVELLGRKRIILPTMNPNMVPKKPLYKTQILKDLDTLKELYEHGMTQISGVTYNSLETLEDVKVELSRMKREAQRVVFDIETTGKSPYMDYSKVVCISLTDKSHYGIVIPLYKTDTPFSTEDLHQVSLLLKDLLETSSIPKSAHNGKFDIEWLRVQMGINVANFDFDTMLAHYLAISEEQGTQGLKSQAWEFTDMGGYDNALDEFVKSLSDGEGVASRYNYDRVPWDILKTYAAADVDCCFRLVEIYKPLIDKNYMWKTLMKDILMPASYTLSVVEENGMKIDMPRANYYNAIYSAEIKRITDRLYKFPEVLEIEREKRSLYKECLELKAIPAKDRTAEDNKKIQAYNKYKNYKFNWGSVTQLRELLYTKLGLVTTVTTAKGELSTNETAMTEIRTQHEIPDLLLELRKVSTLNNMFIQKLPTMRDAKDIIHSSFNLTGTVTGRLSSESPNFQQIPRKAEENPLLFQYHSEPKALFVSRFGENGCIVNADYCLAPDTEIHLINGEIDTIKNICDRLAKGDQLYTYSINPETEKIEISKILAGRKTRENTPTLKITLDNGESVVCTPDHKFMLRTGEDCKAHNLKAGMSLMPFKIVESGSKPTETYRYFGVNKTSYKEHVEVYKYFYGDYERNKIIHHKDHNGLNNNPSNLMLVTRSEHFHIHMKEFWENLSPEERSEFVNSHITEDTRKKLGEKSISWWRSLTPEEYTNFCKKISNGCNNFGEHNPMWGKKHSAHILQQMSEKRTTYNLSQPLDVRKANSCRMLEGRILNMANEILNNGKLLTPQTWEEIRKSHYNPPTWKIAVPVLLKQGLIQNHKIVSIEPYENMDVYNIEVENNHNYPLKAGIFIRNCALEMRISAIISHDKKMTQAFLSGADIHKANAAYMWKVPIEEVTKDLRTKAKSLGFGW